MRKFERRYYYPAYVTLMILAVPAMPALLSPASFYGYIFLLSLSAPFGLLAAFATKLLAQRGFTTGKMYNLTSVSIAVLLIAITAATMFFFTQLLGFMPFTVMAPASALISIVYVLALYICCLVIINLTKTPSRLGFYVFSVCTLFLALPLCLEWMAAVYFCGGAECLPMLGGILGASLGAALFFSAVLYIPMFFAALMVGWGVKFFLSFFFAPPEPSFIKNK